MKLDIVCKHNGINLLMCVS